jgi:xanthine dehydrogenase YagT iron-sulfur-binding subunit
MASKSGDSSPSISTGLNRRHFLATTSSGIVGTVATNSMVAQATEETNVGTHLLKLKINGKDQQIDVDPRTTLLDCLRENIHLTGTKKGCDHGQCGACTVHVNGRRVNSCLSLALMHEGDEITTIEGLGSPEKMHPMQAAFVECDGYQCGYCTSGQIMSAVALLKEPCGPQDDDVRELMSGNICRCGAYPNIVQAIQSVRKTV